MRTRALSVAFLAIAGAASAQYAPVKTSPLEPNPPGSVAYPREDDPAYRRFERQLQADLERRKAELAATGVLSDVSSVTTMPPPNDWRGSLQSWREHMARCSARYRTYNAETDTYFSSPGVSRRCTL